LSHNGFSPNQWDWKLGTEGQLRVWKTKLIIMFYEKLKEIRVIPGRFSNLYELCLLFGVLDFKFIDVIAFLRLTRYTSASSVQAAL